MYQKGHNDAHNLIVILYVITILFIGTIYLQGKITTESKAVPDIESSKIELSEYSAAEESAINSIDLSEYSAAAEKSAINSSVNLHINDDSILLIIVSLTALFGFFLLITRSKPY